MAALLLTPEQLAVVAHNHGPALVFAVAGAGKTTAMVHRIERLVRQQVFAPERILATSFSRATVADIRKSLEKWEHCQPVKVSTLHSLGLKILRQAAQRGHLPELELLSEEGAFSEQRLLKQTLAEARREGVDLPPSLDEQDFLSYVGVCKGNFAYPNPRQLDLPPAALALVTAAQAPKDLPYYLELYRIFEELRSSQGVITFDDMLLSAWECLQRFPSLLQSCQQWFDCLLVDEFQDVNAVQSELLDLLSAGHRNYMAIGDDDQTIYEWRGASPRFILNFPERYQAQKYLLRENFRSRASHLALANRMIVHNKQREPKFLYLTRGFEGQTSLRRPAQESEQAQQLVQDILRSCQGGYRFEQQAILVRLYAQTPYLEQALIEALIPYDIVGSQPFYQRQEIRVLMAYLELALLERQKIRGEAGPDSHQLCQRLWQALANRPVRYLNRHWIDWVGKQLLRGAALPETLEQLALQTDTKFQAKKVNQLLEMLLDLIESGLDQPAATTLRKLEADLKYCEFLRKSSGFPETGEGRALTVEAFLDYCQSQGNCLELKAHLQQLALQQRQEADHSDCITITTIFRAKGLEWPVVYIPHCNQGYLPYSSAHSVEEERRLFYVALTRPQEQLYLYILQNYPESRFLVEAGYEQTLEQVQAARRILHQDISQWQVEDMLTLARNHGHLMLNRYLEHWWRVDPGKRRQAQSQVGGLIALAQKKQILEQLSLSLQDTQIWQAADTAPMQQALHDALEAFLARQKQLQEKLENNSYEVGEAVWSERFGHGTVLAYEPHHRQGALLEVVFGQSEPRKLLARYANLKRLTAAGAVSS